MKSRIAIVDLGTNTFHLLIADVKEGGYSILYRAREAVKLGQHGINQGIITSTALSRALATLLTFRQAMTHHNVKRIFAYGTSALRNAVNQHEIVQTIKQQTDLDVKIISGEEEARLIYLGVRSAAALDDNKSLIIDIGGGSVECIIGNKNQIFWKQSFEIGAQRLLETFHRHDPILPQEVDELKAHLSPILGPLFSALDLHRPEGLVGSSGTFDTLSDIYCLKHGISKEPYDPQTPLSFPGFHEIYGMLLMRNREERMKIPGMIELRVDMIVVACCIIDFILGRYSFEKIMVSSFALKEGMLADIMDTPDKKPSSRQ